MMRPVDGDARALQQDHLHDIFAAGAERHADADLLRALRHRIGDDAVDSDTGEHERESAEQAEQDERDAAAADRILHELIHGADGRNGLVAIDGRQQRCESMR